MNDEEEDGEDMASQSRRTMALFLWFAAGMVLGQLIYSWLTQ